MEIIFAVVLLILIILFNLSNPHNKVNQWCAIAGVFFWFGIAKEAVLYGIIPLFSDADAKRAAFIPVDAIFTWVLYSFAMPAAVIAGLYFCDLDKSRPALLKALSYTLFIPALILTIFFTPTSFKLYQYTSLSFWLTYTAYNFALLVLYIFLMIKGVWLESPGSGKKQKKRIRLLILPPVAFWVLSVFPAHLFNLQELLKLWQLNAAILIVGVIIFLIMAFRDGVFGLKLSGEKYDWNTNMSIAGAGAEYINHMLKNQTAKMELCIEQIKRQYEAGKSPEELVILSRSISNLKHYSDRIKRHTQSISLIDETHRLRDILTDAQPVSLGTSNGIRVGNEIPANIFILCDKSHMTEVFTNIFLNATDAIYGSGNILITGDFSNKTGSRIQIKDSGCGMDEETLNKSFTPYFTTKNTERNFGLGLAYCKNVIEKHGGSISLNSSLGGGTTVTVIFPAKRMRMEGIDKASERRSGRERRGGTDRRDGIERRDGSDRRNAKVKARNRFQSGGRKKDD